MNYYEHDEQRPKTYKDINPNALMGMLWIGIGIYILIQLSIGLLN